tara:strand:- start:24742 stop:25194 length:453 start_codon:yes stop_codon:yes gene_type:complete
MNTSNIVAEVSLKYNPVVSPNDLPLIDSPDKAHDLLRSVWDQDSFHLVESFMILILNSAKRCLGWSLISRGNSRSTIVDPKNVFQLAMLANGDSILCAHNHCGGVLKASRADIQLTKRIKEAGDLLSIPLVDHIILTADGYLSMKSLGLL